MNRVYLRQDAKELVLEIDNSEHSTWALCDSTVLYAARGQLVSPYIAISVVQQMVSLAYAQGQTTAAEQLAQIREILCK